MTAQHAWLYRRGTAGRWGGVRLWAVTLHLHPVDIPMREAEAGPATRPALCNCAPRTG